MLVGVIMMQLPNKTAISATLNAIHGSIKHPNQAWSILRILEKPPASPSRSTLRR